MTCHSRLRPLPARGGGPRGPVQRSLWRGDGHRTPLLEFPGGLMSPVSVFRVRSLTPYLIGICALAVVRQSRAGGACGEICGCRARGASGSALSDRQQAALFTGGMAACPLTKCRAYAESWAEAHSPGAGDTMLSASGRGASAFALSLDPGTAGGTDGPGPQTAPRGSSPASREPRGPFWPVICSCLFA